METDDMTVNKIIVQKGTFSCEIINDIWYTGRVIIKLLTSTVKY